MYSSLWNMLVMSEYIMTQSRLNNIIILLCLSANLNVMICVSIYKLPGFNIFYFMIHSWVKYNGMGSEFASEVVDQNPFHTHIAKSREESSIRNVWFKRILFRYKIHRKGFGAAGLKCDITLSKSFQPGHIKQGCMLRGWDITDRSQTIKFTQPILTGNFMLQLDTSTQARKPRLYSEVSAAHLL